MKKLVSTFSLISTLLLVGCSSYKEVSHVVYLHHNNGEHQDFETEKLILEALEPISYNAPIYFPYLPEYTEQLAYTLKQSLKDKELEGSIVVSNFVLLSHSIKEGNTLGRQVAELLATDLQNNKLPVSVASLDNYVDIPKIEQPLIVNTAVDISNSSSDKGKDIPLEHEILTNEVLELTPNITYICTGTLMETKHGVLINVKIIHRKTYEVIASANKTLPFAVLNVERNKPIR